MLLVRLDGRGEHFRIVGAHEREELVDREAAAAARMASRSISSDE